MGSKKKTSKSIKASNEFATLELDSELKPVDDKAEASAAEMSESAEDEDAELDELLGEKSKDDIIEKANSSKFLARLTPEMTEKLEKIDALEKHCLELEEENAKLSDSVNSYLEELDVLKKKRGAKAASNAEESSLAALGDDLADSSHELGEMRRQLKDLREENDSYLMKISELTFENAKLTS